MEIARKRATEIATDWGHQGLSDDCADCGENIVKGGKSINNLFQSWVSSEGHHNNMLGGYSLIGTGVYRNGKYTYAVQIFK
jgi:uncharacterized protein YkwD